MATLTVKYGGGLIAEAKHLKSGSEIKTDAPEDNNGKGSTFSPTDLTAVSLASCMITLMGIKAEKNGFSISEVDAIVKKEMKTAPRRIGAVIITMNVKNRGYSEEQKSCLWEAAVQCPVAHSLHPDIEQSLEMNFVD